MTGYQALAVPLHQDLANGDACRSRAPWLSKGRVLFTIGAIAGFVAAFCTLAPLYYNDSPLLHETRSPDQVIDGYINNPQNHPEFDGIAERSARPGWVTFLVDDVHVARLDDEPLPAAMYSKHGYILVRTRENGENAVHREIHYWLGSDVAPSTKFTTAIKTVSLGRILRTGTPSQRHEDNQSLMALLDGQPISFADGEDSRCQSIFGAMRARRQIEQGYTLVVDIGSAMTKAGFVGADQPRVVIPTLVGRGSLNDYYAGEDALKLSNVLTLIYPVVRGLVTDWTAYRELLKHVFLNELRVDPAFETPVFLAEQVQTPRADREAKTSMAFNNFNVPAFYLQSSEFMAMFASGRTSGLVVSSGDTVTTVVPIYEGNVQTAGVRRFALGGRNITNYFRTLVPALRTFTTPQQTVNVTSAKEKACYVAFDYAASLTGTTTGLTYTDGPTFTVNKERFRCAEPMFQPSLVNLTGDPLHRVILNSINSFTDSLIRKELWNNIVLAGGNTMFLGFPERLDKELRALVPTQALKVVAPPERRDTAWLGASTLASLSTFSSMWITSQDFASNGPSIVHTKCAY